MIKFGNFFFYLCEQFNRDLFNCLYIVFGQIVFDKQIVNETPNGTMTVPYDKVKTIHFLKDSFVIEDDRGVGIIVSKNGFGDADFMDCVNFLCEQCSNLEL